MSRISRRVGVALFAVLVSACARQPAVDTVTLGQGVAVTKADGGVVEGTVTARDQKTVQVKTGRTTKTIPKDEIVDVQVVDETKPVVLPPVAKYREYTVPAGTRLVLTLATPINSGTNRVEDPVDATLAEAVSIGGVQALPANSTVKGVVSAVKGSAKVKGLASLSVRFTSLAAAGRDDRYDIDATYSETAQPTKTADATKIGIGAGIGAAIGGILGGKGGAAKGAVIGGGAGTAVVLDTKGQEVNHAAGTTLTVTLARDVDVRLPIGEQTK